MHKGDVGMLLTEIARKAGDTSLANRIMLTPDAEAHLTANGDQYSLLVRILNSLHEDVLCDLDFKFDVSLVCEDSLEGEVLISTRVFLDKDPLSNRDRIYDYLLEHWSEDELSSFAFMITKWP